jgi:hypothetical protein
MGGGNQILAGTDSSYIKYSIRMYVRKELSREYDGWWESDS